MAAALNAVWKQVAMPATLISWFALAAIPACAADLQDPTKPPVAYAASTQGESAVTGEQKPEVVMELQSILVSRHRKLAVIGGQTLKVGDKIGDAQLVGITDTEVTLRDGTGTRVLTLFPEIEKRVASRRASVASRRMDR